MITKLKANDEFKNRLDCFSCFKGLIEKNVGFDKSKLFSRNREVEEICKNLKMLAKELEIPIIVTS